LIRQGEVGDKFYLIRRGQCEVSIADGASQRVVNTLAEGDFFGEMALLTGTPRSATVVTTDETEVYTLGKEDFAAAVAASASFKEQLLKVFFQRQLGCCRWAMLKENADVLGQQDVLVENNFAAGNLPGPINTPEDILPSANVEVLLDLAAGAVHQVVGVDFELGRCISLFHLDVANDMAGPGGWILGPGHPRVKARNAGTQSGLGLVENGQLFLRRPLYFGSLRLVEASDGLALCRIAITAHRHPVAHVLSKQFNPLMQPALV